MTSLVKDAVCTEVSDPFKVFANPRIKSEVLQEIINDLDEREIISIIFLMVDKDTDFSKVIEEVKEDPLIVFSRLTSKSAWAEKLLESLIIIGNKYVVGKMGYNQYEIQCLENLFSTKQHNVSPNLNTAIKSLYFLCENLDYSEARKLVTDVNSKLRNPLHVDRSKFYLELYILEWFNQKYISIDPDKFSLSNLLKNLKNIGCLLDLPFHFDDWENSNSFINNNEQDSYNYLRINNQSTLEKLSSENNHSVCKNSDFKWSTTDHEKLCIIINQINFTNREKYESREGSEIDERSLKETFSGCGFDIELHRDFTKQQMTDLLESLNSKDKSYSTYGAIFICILSHGFEGEVVFSDDTSLSIATIKDKFCCRKLQKVFKFLILQSCQGKQIGLGMQLVRDGPSKPMCSINPLICMHFGLFQATIRNFAAMRHKKDGSWFIQDLCREIREASRPMDIRDLILNVKARVTSRRSPSGDKMHEIVQVPISSDTITVPYILPQFEKKI